MLEAVSDSEITERIYDGNKAIGDIARHVDGAWNYYHYDDHHGLSADELRQLADLLDQKEQRKAAEIHVLWKQDADGYWEAYGLSSSWRANEGLHSQRVVCSASRSECDFRPQRGER